MYAQLIRYAVAGSGAAAVYSSVYLVIANLLSPGQAAIAVVPAFLTSLLVSFILHSRWSFSGHGHRDEKVMQPLRFTLVQTAGLLLNLVITYVVTQVLLAPNWVALIPSLMLTPLATFALQRYWVFR